MNSKMTTNSQLSTTEPKQQQEETKQATRTGIESQKWRSHRGLSVERGREKNGMDNKKHNQWAQNRQGG